MLYKSALHPVQDPTLEVWSAPQAEKELPQAEKELPQAEKEVANIGTQQPPGKGSTGVPLICGVRRATFFVVLGLSIACIVAAIGGGLGAALTKEKSKKAADASIFSISSSAASLSTPSTPSFPSSVGPTTSNSATDKPSATAITGPNFAIWRDCPSANGSIIETGPDPAQRFVKYCSFLYKENRESSLFAKSVSSLDDCISLCALYNSINATGPAGPCTSVCWRTNATDVLFGYCWSQYSTSPGFGEPATDSKVNNAPVDSAMLLE